MRENYEQKNIQNESAPSFSEKQNGDTIRFVCILGTKEVGSISATLVSECVYDIGGLFVDPLQRGKGIGHGLVKLVTTFLEKNKALGKLVTASGDAMKINENNNWKKGDYKSQGAFGGYEYTYDCRE